MKYGCIGEHLTHSFSREIHEKIGKYSYQLQEIAPEDLDTFLTEREFAGINVTIPYKQRVIPFCERVDESAHAIGAVNTVVNRQGKLYGYNTDFGGLKALIERMNFDFSNQKILILGTGGTAKTASAVAKSLGAGEILQVSRTKKTGVITYEEAYTRHADASFLINTTPCGMFPRVYESPVDLKRFQRLKGVVDVVYNPLRTSLVLDSLARNIPAVGGLYMLVHQAVLSSQFFTGTSDSDDTTMRIYRQLLQEKESIVLVGMPGCGKTTVGKILAERSGRLFVDTDEEIVRKSGMSIPEIFEHYGEGYFRDLETETIKEIGTNNHAVIATGGGAVLREENRKALRHNGRIYFLDRPLDQLIPTSDRPLAGTEEAIRKRYEERYDIYCQAADERIDCNGSPESTALEIERRHQR